MLLAGFLNSCLPLYTILLIQWCSCWGKSFLRILYCHSIYFNIKAEDLKLSWYISLTIFFVPMVQCFPFCSVTTAFPLKYSKHALTCCASTCLYVWNMLPPMILHRPPLGLLSVLWQDLRWLSFIVNLTSFEILWFIKG